MTRPSPRVSTLPAYPKERIGVVGFGKTGRALLDFILKEGLCSRPLLYNDTPLEESLVTAHYQDHGVEFAFGERAISELEKTELVLMSPGVNGRSARFSAVRDKGIPVLSEIEFAAGFIETDIIAVTGTNGKSTTVSLIDHILRFNGVKSVLAGNIGVPLVGEIERITQDTVVVLEVSSFQLEEIKDFKPRVAVLLNITPDHLDRYPSMEEYVLAKFNIFKNQDENDVLIINDDDPRLRTLPDGPMNLIRFSASHVLPTGLYLEGDQIVEKKPPDLGRISLEKNPLVGIHNRENLLAAAAVARIHGIGYQEIAASLPEFSGLPHRMERVGRLGDVEFINDSKATNVDAALKSIQSLDGNGVVILGGKDKGGDFSALQEVLKKKAKRILLIGEAADTIYHQLSDIRNRCVRVLDLAEAVESGRRFLQDGGGVVLLAPACASFDMFHNFEDRGDTFRREVVARMGGGDRDG